MSFLLLLLQLLQNEDIVLYKGVLKSSRPDQEVILE